MNANVWKELGISPDTEDLRDLSLAIASRGVLEGISEDDDLLRKPGQWEDYLAAAIQGSGHLRWVAPVATQAQDKIGSLSATALANAWKNSFGDLEHRARLAVEPVFSGPRWTADAALIAKAIVALNQKRNPPPILGVRSVFTKADLAPKGPARWPLHIGILPGESARELLKSIGAVSMVRRGLANVSILRRGDADCDLLIAPFPLRELRGRALSLGIMPTASTVIVPREGLENMAQRAVLLQRLQEDIGAGVVVTGMPSAGLEGQWINEVVRSLSHHEPLDVALWEADQSARSSLGESEAARLRPPMIFANPAAISSTPIDLQKKELEDRLLRIGKPLSLDAGTSQQFKFGATTETAGVEAIDIVAGLKTLRFDREADGASVLVDVANAIAAAEPVDPGPIARPPLFGDVTFFDTEASRRVDDLVEPLVTEREYFFEVALRRVPSGISHRGGPQEPIAPLPAEESTELLVVVQANDADFRITQPTLSIALPPNVNGDSSVARFSIKPLRSTPTKEQLCCIEVRIYYEFNLLEVLVVRAAVKDKYGFLKDDLLKPTPIYVEQSERVSRCYQDLNRWQSPRSLSIDLRREGDVARFTFTARQKANGEVPVVALPGRLDIPLSRLMPVLNRMRHLWEEVAVNLIGSTLQPSDSVFQETLLRLAIAGRDLWTLLFRGAKNTSMSVIGEWLWKHPAEVGSVIDVRLLDGASSFAFPWSLLYDRELPPGTKKADPDGFWGIRYAIGQSAMDWYQGDDPLVPSPASRLEFMLWGSFPNGAEQSQLLKDLESSSKARLVVKPAITTKPDFYRMVQDCDADMLYFYTHGHTRPVEADSGYNPVQRIKDRFEKLDEAQRAASGLQPLYDLISDKDFQPDESWIALTLGRLSLQEMRAQPMNLHRAPVVFLNMCQSAQVLPGLADSFVTFFLERNARSVLGTECPMTTVFAHPFSERVLKEFFAGQSLGDSLRVARRHFMDQRNPLGLAYSLFGAATARYDRALI